MRLIRDINNVGGMRGIGDVCIWIWAGGVGLNSGDGRSRDGMVSLANIEYRGIAGHVSES
jgi:hypothetical protein